MVYHPRLYDESYVYALPADRMEINYTVANAKYVAFYVPGTKPMPKRLWVAFCGNGSLAYRIHAVRPLHRIKPFDYGHG